VTLTGPEQILDRTGLTLTAVPPDDMQKLLSADTIKLWVDVQIGILLREESWQAGRLISDQVATQVALNPQVTPGTFRITVPAGARELSPAG
jgi:outer membrane lipoprotein-sorting protein